MQQHATTRACLPLLVPSGITFVPALVLCCLFIVSPLSARDQGRGPRGGFSTFCIHEISDNCFQYHVTKQSVINLQDSIPWNSWISAVSWHYLMFSVSFLECGHETVYSLPAAFLSGSLDSPFHLCPECLVGHGQCQMELQCLLKGLQYQTGCCWMDLSTSFLERHQLNPRDPRPFGYVIVVNQHDWHKKSVARSYHADSSNTCYGTRQWGSIC